VRCIPDGSVEFLCASPSHHRRDHLAATLRRPLPSLPNRPATAPMMLRANPLGHCAKHRHSEPSATLAEPLPQGRSNRRLPRSPHPHRRAKLIADFIGAANLSEPGRIALHPTIAATLPLIVGFCAHGNTTLGTVESVATITEAIIRSDGGHHEAGIQDGRRHSRRAAIRMGSPNVEPGCRD
jgi:hypothetical protein